MKTLALTCGDPAGIGPEIIESWLGANPALGREVALIGPGRWLESLKTPVEKIPVGLDGFEAKPGQPSGEGALVAWAALERAAAGCVSGEFKGVVTAPVSKEWLARIGWPFPGHTEFFGARWGGDPTMGFCGGRLSVVLLTWHIRLMEVTAHLTEREFERSVKAAAELAAAAGARNPRIGVCGLNPHAGEAGMFGDEEREVIDPILDRLRLKHPGLSRALPGDTVFGRQLKGEFDVVLALYHDQGLAPLKTVDFDSAVNVTLGLPHVRTSPDHGTAFDIAGKAKADFRSFSNAVEVARRLVAIRGGPGLSSGQP